jgi:rhomboid protease GluP
LDRWREKFSGMLRGEDRAKRPRLCPACGQLVGAEQNRCSSCGTSLTFSLAAASRGLAEVMPQPHPVTKIIMGLNFFMYIVCIVATYSATQQISMMGGISGQVLFRLGSRNTYELLVRLQWWRLIMPIFLHANLLHIGLNTWVLIDFGPALEDLYGSARYLFLYMVTGILGFVFSTGWDIIRHQLGGSIGASGAIMGLAGLHLAVSSRRGGAYFQAMRASLLRWVVIVFAFGFLAGGVDNAAHLGGLVSGYLLGRVFYDREPGTASERLQANLMALAALVAVIGSFAAMIAHYSDALS